MKEGALLEAARSLLRHRGFEDAARSIFDSCKKLIGATAGYIAMLSGDGTENELLFLESGGLSCDVDPALPMPIRGLRAVAYQSGKPVYDNDFASSEWVKFLPPGHAPLDNVLFAPLAIDGAVVGLLGLANKPGGFTKDDGRVASAFAELAAVALHNSRTLQALEQSEDRYRSLVETAVDAIISIDSDGSIILWNRSAESMFGYRADEVIGKPLGFIMPERFRKAHQEAMEGVVSTGRSSIIGKTVELAGLRRDGGEFPLELSVARWGADDRAFFTAVIRDITERKRVEDALAEQRALLQAILDQAVDGIIVCDAQGDFTYVNESARRLAGLTPEQAKKRSNWGRPYTIDRQRVARQDRVLSRALRGEVVSGHEARMVRPNGTSWDILLSGAPIRNERGEVVAAVSTFTDISGRKQVEEALRESEERFRNLFNAMSEGFAIAELICDADGKPQDYRFLSVNPAFEPLTGLRPADVEGRTVREVLPGIESTWIQRFGEVALTGKPQRFESHAQPLGRWYEVHAFRTQPMQFAVVFVDATERKQSEEALAEQRAALQSERDLLQTVMENTRAHLAYLDPDFNFVMVNSTYAEGSGHTVEELIGRNHFDLFPDPENQAIFEKVRDSGEPVRYVAKPFEFVDQPERGITYWDWTLVPLKDASGRVQSLVLSLMDVTERKRAEEELREHREDLNRAQAVASTGSWRLDVRRNELRWSDETYRMFGIPQGTPLTYESFLATVHPDDREYVDREWTAAMSGQPYDIEHRIVVGDTVKWVRERAELEFDENGMLVGGFGTVQDVTERKLVEEAIEQERRRLQTLVDTSPVGIILVDAGGRLILANREARRLVGASVGAGDSLERFAAAAVRRRPDGSQYGPGELPVERALNLGESVRAEQFNVHQEDGLVVPVVVDAVPVYGASGEIAGAILVEQDITPLEELDKLRHEFLGMVSHELRTPLTAIKGSAATALGSSMPLGTAQTRELFQIIDEQAERLRSLVDNLLDISRIEAGALSIEPEPVDLQEIIEEAHAGFMREAGLHEVRLQLPDTLPTVNADRHRVSQVIVNLLNNAAKFSPPMTPITVSADVEPLWVTVHVHDEGRGIPKGDLPRLFKKFSRPHEKGGAKLPGSGLGLAICKGIVEAHGGRIWAESKGEGRGTTISFSLPVAAESVAAPEDTRRGGSATARVSRRGDRRRVLAVDDEAHVLRYLQHTLEEAGYEPVVTSDPSQVNKLLETSEPDLVLLDLRLPGISGFEVLERVRELSEAPVIFLTASDREDDAVRALRMGADDYITKPFSPSELLARVDAVLRRRTEAPVAETRRPFALGDLKIDFATREVTLAGEPMSLSPTEYKLLCELAVHAGRVLTYDQILKRAWGPEYSGETDLVRAFVRNLRRKLGDDARDPTFILTERGVGYRMATPKA